MNTKKKKRINVFKLKKDHLELGYVNTHREINDKTRDSRETYQTSNFYSK